MIVFSVELIALQAAVPVAGPVVAAGVGLLAALVSCALPPLLLQPATAAAASAIAPMASFFLIVCSPSGPADLPASAGVGWYLLGSPGADPSRLGTMSDVCLAFCVHLPRLSSGGNDQDITCLNRCAPGK